MSDLFEAVAKGKKKRAVVRIERDESGYPKPVPASAVPSFGNARQVVATVTERDDNGCIKEIVFEARD